MKVSWTQHKTNEEVLQMVETERGIMDTVRSWQKRWLGHILRHDSLLRITLEGQIQGKKVYGRPRTMFLDWLLKTEEGNISYEDWGTKDVSTRQIKIASVKMETCHTGRTADRFTEMLTTHVPEIGAENRTNKLVLLTGTNIQHCLIR